MKKNKLVRQYKDLTIESAEITDNRLNLSFSCESNMAVRQIKGKVYLELLKHEAGYLDMSMLQDGGLPLLLDHKASVDTQIGMVDQIELDQTSRKLRGVATFSSSEKAQQVLEDIRSGVLRGVSFGYRFHPNQIEWTTDQAGNTIGAPKPWAPFEVSIVAIPEDVSVGFFKSAETDEEETEEETTDQTTETEETPNDEPTTEESSSSSDESDTNENETENKLSNADSESDNSPSTDEPEAETNQKARTFSIEEKTMEPKVTLPAAVDFAGKDSPIRSYSVTKHVKGLLAGGLQGAEAEVATELGSQTVIPTAAFKAFNITSGNTEFNIPQFGGYLDLLLPQSVLGKLGIPTMNLAGGVAMPGAETPDSAVVSEVDGSGASAGSVTSREVVFSPKIAVAAFEISRVALDNATPGMEAYLTRTMLAKHAADMERKAVAAFISEVAAGMKVSVTDHDLTGNETQILDLIAKVTNKIDLPVGSAFLTNWKLFNKLKTLKRVATLDRAVAEGETIWDQPAVASAHVKPTAVGSYDPLMFGAWSNALMASFGQGVNIVVDPYSLAIKDQVRLTGQAHFDAHLMNLDAFSLIEDAN